MAWGMERPVRVRFTGTRVEMAGLLLRGFALLVPTIGLYRFWLTTWKRRFYWGHTEIDGDPLEYTGNAHQLLLGFLMALAVFVPLYGLFIYLSTLATGAAIIGYGGVGVLVWFLMGYAIYRARDFRLSRTLWRGIRFDQAGNAWLYALRRFLWSLLVLVTAGLAYPLMAANLWSYRYRHSWYGDRAFGFAGHWKQLAGPYYLCWFLGAIIVVAGLTLGAGMGAFPEGSTPDPAGFGPIVIAGLLIGALHLFYRSRELTRMFSSVRLGEARLAVTIRTRSLIGQYLLFALALAGALLALLVGGLVVLGAVASDAFADGGFDLGIFMQHLQQSMVVLLAIVFGYLLILAAFTFVAELFLGLAFWKLVAGNATVTGLDSLRDVRARGEDGALAGEGLADALNVGSY